MNTFRQSFLQFTPSEHPTGGAFDQKNTMEVLVFHLRAPFPIASVLFSFLLCILLATAVNIISQLWKQHDTSKPPVVLHYFPVIGSTITYGKDPLTFFAECKAKVSSRIPLSRVRLWADVVIFSTATSLLLSSLADQ
jgi:sterol 14-demethylase